MVNGIGNKFGRMIAVVRTLRGWNQAKLAKECNVAARYLSKYENDLEIISQVHLDRIEKTLGVNFDELYPEFERFATAAMPTNGHTTPTQEAA